MKLLPIFTTLSLIISAISFAQGQRMIYDKLLRVSVLDNIEIFADAQTIISFQTQEDEKRALYNFQVARMDWQENVDLQIKYDKTNTHTFFGGHFQDKNFIIFEAEYVVIDKTLLIHRHFLSASEKNFKSTILHKSKDFSNSKANFKLLISENDKHQAICYLSNEKNIQVLWLHKYGERAIPFELKPISALNQNSEFQAAISNRGNLSVLVEHEGSRDHNYSLISSNVSEMKTILHTNLLLDKNAVLRKSKLLYNQELLTIYSVVSSNKKDNTAALYLWENINPTESKEARAKIIKNVKADQFTDIHSILTLPNGSTVLNLLHFSKRNLLLQYPEYQITEDMSAEEKQALKKKLEVLEQENRMNEKENTERRRQPIEETKQLAVVMLNKNNEMVWSQNLPSLNTASKTYNPASHSYYLWADDESIRCFFNVEVEINTTTSDPVVSISSQQSSLARNDVKMNPMQRVFSLRDGAFKDYDLEQDENMNEALFLPNASQIRSSEFAWMFFYMPHKGLVPSMYRF